MNLGASTVGIICILIALWMKAATPFPTDEWLFTLFGIGFLWWGLWIGGYD